MYFFLEILKPLISHFATSYKYVGREKDLATVKKNKSESRVVHENFNTQPHCWRK